MKKNVLVGLVLAMAVMGGCAESDVSGDVQESGEGTAVSAIAEDEVASLAESERGAVSESVTEKVTERESEGAQTEEMKLISYEHTYVRKSEEESRTVTIDSDVFPYDCEEMYIRVDTEVPYYKDIEPYDCIDLANLVNYPNLKRLSLSGSAYNSSEVKVINGDSIKRLEHLESIGIVGVDFEGEWLCDVSSLKTLGIDVHGTYDWNFTEKLGKSSALKALSIGCGKCNDWSFLGNFTYVEKLELWRTDTSDLSFINQMSSLTDLTIDQCNLYDGCFDGVEDNYSVKRLILSENVGIMIPLDNGEYDYKYLTDVTGVCRFKGLERLEVCETYLVDEDRQIEYVRENLPECDVSIGIGYVG